MKKLLLSSIIMLGVCGTVSAQTSSKTKKNDLNSTSASAVVAPTPQKAAVAPTEAVVAAPAATAADKQAAQVATPVNKAQVKQAQARATSPVNAPEVAVPSEEEKIKADKAEKAKAAGENEKKNQQ